MNDAVPVSDAVGALRATLDHARLSQAHALAHAGSYAEADSILGELDPQQVAVLHLRARIRAQQGRAKEAEQLWLATLLRSPDHAGARAGLARLQDGTAGWVRTAATLLVLCACGFVVAAVIRIGIGESSWRTSALLVGTGLAPLLLAYCARRPDASRIASLTRLEAAVAEQLGRLRRHGAPLPAELTVDVPGVDARREGSELVLVFEEGLFSARGDRLAAGRARVQSVARRLEPHRDSVRIVLVGHSGALPAGASPRRGRLGLGMARAWAVFREMRSVADLPADRFDLRSAGLRDAPFAPPDPRNETVVIRVSLERAEGPAD